MEKRAKYAIVAKFLNGNYPTLYKATDTEYGVMVEMKMQLSIPHVVVFIEALASSQLSVLRGLRVVPHEDCGMVFIR